MVEALAPQRLVLCSSGTGADYRITWSLRPVRRRRRGCTAITVTHEAVPTAPYGRVVALLLGGLAARAVEAALWRDLADIAAAAGAAGSVEAAERRAVSPRRDLNGVRPPPLGRVPGGGAA